MAPDIHFSPAAGNRAQGGTHPQGDERKRARVARLRSLLLATQSGPVDAARLAFTSLTTHDLELSHHPVIARIGAALQSSQLPEAWRISQELRPEFPLAFVAATAAIAVRPPPRGFFGGLSGRRFDLSA